MSAYYEDKIVITQTGLNELFAAIEALRINCDGLACMHCSDTTITARIKLVHRLIYDVCAKTNISTKPWEDELQEYFHGERELQADAPPAFRPMMRRHSRRVPDDWDDAGDFTRIRMTLDEMEKRQRDTKL